MMDDITPGPSDSPMDIELSLSDDSRVMVPDTTGLMAMQQALQQVQVAVTDVHKAQHRLHKWLIASVGAGTLSLVLSTTTALIVARNFSVQQVSEKSARQSQYASAQIAGKVLAAQLVPVFAKLDEQQQLLERLPAVPAPAVAAQTPLQTSAPPAALQQVVARISEATATRVKTHPRQRTVAKNRAIKNLRHRRENVLPRKKNEDVISFP
jgi:hypothetical protein